jgi:hypothetical protein
MDPIEVATRPGESPPGEQREVDGEREAGRAYTAPELAAVERVTAYFQAVGLQDESCLAKATRAVMNQAANREISPAELPRQAVQLAMHMVDAWLNDLMHASAKIVDGTTEPGLLAVFLRRALHERPEAFLNQANTPDSFRSAVELAAASVLPVDRPRRMPRQRLGRLFPFLRPAFWRRLIRGPHTLPHGKPRGYPRAIADEPQ